MNDNFNYCRLCAEIIAKTELIDTQTDEKFNITDIELKIYNLFTIEMIGSSELPNTVCTICFEKFLLSCGFKEQIIKAQEILRDILLPKTNIKNEIHLEDDNINDSFSFNDDDLIDEKGFEVEDKVVPLESKFSAEDRQEQETENENDSTGNPKGRKLRGRRKKTLKEEKSRKKRTISSEVWESYEWKCNDCDVEISSMKHLRRHYTEIHKKPPEFVCSKCFKVYQEKQFSAFYKHVCRHTQGLDDPNQYRCSDCGKLSKSKTLHDMHRKTHTVNIKHICPECGKCFKSYSYLRKHANIHLPDEAKPKFPCTKCDKQFLTQSALKYHDGIHTGTRSLIYCEQCAKSFTTKSNLELHIKTQHSEGRPYQCPQCPKNFKSLPNLHTHLKVHRGLRPHRCEQCGKSFATKSTLKRHSSTHSGVLPFECEYCHKRFRIAQFLKIHIRQHTGERPFSCEECNHHFANSSNYIKHMKGRHGILSIAKNPVNCNIKFLVSQKSAVKAE